MKISKPAWTYRSFLASTLLLLAAGCGNNSNTANNATNVGEEAPGVKSVLIGYNPVIAQPQPLLGLLEAEYAKRLPGVSVNGRVYDAGPAVLEALRAGVVDIACSGPFPAMKAYAKSGDVVLLGGLASGGIQLMVGKTSPIKTVAQLKGKIIGVNQPGSNVEVLVRHNLIKAGLNPDKDVKIVEIKPAEQAEALKRGEVSAVAAPAPWPAVVQVTGNARPLLDWKQIYGNGQYLAGSIYTTKKFAEANREFLKKFMEANRALTAELNKDRAKADARVLSAWSKVTGKKLDSAPAKLAFSTLKYTVDADEAALQKFADINHEMGLIKQKPNLKGFVFKP